jgi:predicted secreted protein
MPGAQPGRNAVMKKGATPIAGVRVSSFTRDATPIDITDRDAAGFPTVLGGAGNHSSATLQFSIEGIEKDGVLEGIALDPDADWLLTDITFVLVTGQTISGNFYFGSYQSGNDHKEASTFSGTMTSSGKWSYAVTV